MNSKAVRFAAILASLVLVGTVALAAGSESKPKTDSRPGVEDYNARLLWASG